MRTRFKIDEPLDRVPRELTRAELDRKARNPWVTIPDYTEVPSGRLRLRLPVTYHKRRRSMWQDGKRQRLEDVLGAFLAEVEQRAVLDEQVRLEREERERERERRAEEQRRAAELRRLSAHRDQHVRDTVEAWRLARDVRALCAEMTTVTRTAAGSADWRSWALDLADRVDPTVRIPQLPAEAPPAEPSWRTPGWR